MEEEGGQDKAFGRPPCSLKVDNRNRNQLLADSENGWRERSLKREGAAERGPSALGRRLPCLLPTGSLPFHLHACSRTLLPLELDDSGETTGAGFSVFSLWRVCLTSLVCNVAQGGAPDSVELSDSKAEVLAAAKVQPGSQPLTTWH